MIDAMRRAAGWATRMLGMRWRNLSLPWRIVLAVAVLWLFGAAFLLALLVQNDRLSDLPNSVGALRAAGSFAALAAIVVVALRARRPLASTTGGGADVAILRNTYRPAWSPFLWAGIPVTPLSGVFLALALPLPPAARVGVAGVTLLAVMGLAWMLTTYRYRLADDALIILSPPFRTVLPWEQMMRGRVHRVVGQDRLTLEMKSGKRVTLAVPEDRDGFLRAIRAKNPNLPFE